MHRRSRFSVVLATAVVTLVAVLGACAVQHRARSNALEFLYPTGVEAVPPGDVHLQLPVRVGLAFAPAGTDWRDAFTEAQKQELLERIAAAFRDREPIAAVEAIPTDFLTPNGGFDNVDRLRAAFGIDLLVLVSYDQFQFSESTGRSWTYWTLVGAYFVKGEKNETRTVLNAAVYDIPSRSMLFHATGESAVGGRAAPVNLQRSLRERSALGFSEATDGLIEKLDVALAAFQEQVATGTVRGAGTPALTVQDAEGKPVGGGAGAAGALELLVVGLLGWAAWRTRRESGPDAR